MKYAIINTELTSIGSSLYTTQDTLLLAAHIPFSCNLTLSKLMLSFEGMGKKSKGHQEPLEYYEFTDASVERQHSTKAYKKITILNLRDEDMVIFDSKNDADLYWEVI